MAFTGKNIVPIVDGGAGLGSITKGWGGAFITNVTASSATEGGKLVLAANDGAVMASGHRLGVIEFKGAEDTASTLTIGARIEALCDATWSASENGASLKMYTTDANASESLVLTLDSNKLATFTGGIDLATSTGISINGTDIVTDSSGTATLSNIDALDATTIATFETAMEANLDTMASQFTSAASLATIGTITTGVWNGTAIASAYLDSDTAHLTTDQTFTGRKTFNANTAFNGNITATSATGDSPIITMKNTTDDDQASQLIFEKLRDDDAVATGQNLGEIWFRGQDSAQNTEDYAYILGEIDVSTNGQESGQLKFGLANHDGGNGNGLILTGGSADNEIDVTLGLGTSSVTTVAGTLTMGSTAALTNAGLVAVANQSSITGLGTISSGVWNGTAIAHAYIGNDAIDGDNLADDAVNSEHYTDGSIDTAHIADDQVTFAKVSGVTPNVYGSIIKLLPSDFAANIDGGNTKLGVGYTDTAGSAYGMKVGSANAELFAFVSIPEGMKATHVDVFDKDDRALEVFEVQINATSLTSKGSGNCNTTLDITDVNATATNFLAIKITTTATTDKVFGGQVTIAAQ